jgi:SAM-dependent methyltransferase
MIPSLDCPLCGSSKTRETQSFEAQDVVRRWREIHQIDVRREFRGQPTFTLRQCGQCSLGYFYPFAICGSPQLYGDLQRFPWYYMSEKWEHVEGLKDLGCCKSVLEFGSGFGDFVKLAGARGIQVKGLEINPLAIEEAMRRGIILSPAALEEIGGHSGEKFDAVVAFQGLEHVPSPKEFLQQCCELLAPSGLLILGLPNADSFLRLQSNILDLPPHHCSRWSLSTIRYLPRLFPLRLRRMALEPLAEYHVENYIDAHTDRLARTVLPPANHPFVKSRLRQFLVRTGLRKLLTGMTVYAAFEKLGQ